MPKQQLSGPLDEQLNTIYEAAQERMRSGSYSGAVHYLKQIQQVKPGYRDVPALLAQAQAAKREHSFLLWVSILISAILVVVTRQLGWTSDLVSFGVGIVGLLVGWLVASVLYIPFRRRSGSR